MKTHLCKDYENAPVQDTEINENFQLKNFEIFLILAQNVDCGYTLKLPHIPTIYVLEHIPVLLFKSGV